MKSVKVVGRAIQNLDGLKVALQAASFLVLWCDSIANDAGSPVTIVNLNDAEMKNPTAVVNGFVDNTNPQTKLTMMSPNGSKWTVCVNNAGVLECMPIP